MSQLKRATRWTLAGPGPTWYGIGRVPPHLLGAMGPLRAARRGWASPYEIGRTGILERLWASRIERRFASGVAPTPGVRGSPG
jgi:hypothetical protein